MSCCRRLVFLLVGSVPFFMGVPAVRAQTESGSDPVAARTAQASSDFAAQLRAQFPIQPILLAPTIADRTPYTDWKQHVGAAADALVTAQVTLRNHNTGETIVQKGAGVIVRCDGLVLLPSCLLHGPTPAVNEKTSFRVVDISLSCLDAQGANLPKTWTASPPRFSDKRIPYVLVKARDMHFRAAVLLNSQNLLPSRTVEIVYPQETAKPGAARLEVVHVKARIVKNNDGRLEIAYDTPAVAAPPNVPPGAVVVDAESKMAVGILAPPVTDTGASATLADFTVWDQFHDISNSVGLVPKPDDRLTAGATKEEAGAKKDGMVWIPGGPLFVDTRNYPEVGGANVVCVPGFWIDQAEVTVGQYGAFLKATDHHPLPAGWTEADTTGTTSRHNADLPVHGVSPADAAAYAAWVGKRLALPVEWEWAARGAGSATVSAVDLGPSARRRWVEGAGPGVYIASVGGGEGVSFSEWHRIGLDPVLDSVEQRRGGRYGLQKINQAVAASNAPWPSVYANATTAVEMNLRWVAMIDGYTEAKFWFYWQNLPTKDTPGKPHILKPSPEFQDLIDFATPINTVSDFRYLHAVEDPNVLLKWTQGVGPTHSRYTATQDSLRIISDMFNPLPIAPPGSREYDRSYFDVFDLGTNVDEWLQANRSQRPEERLEKVLPPLFDPDQQPRWQDIFFVESTHRLADFNTMLNDGNRFNFPIVKSKVDLLAPEDQGVYANSWKVAPVAARKLGFQQLGVGAGVLDPWVNQSTMLPKLAQYPTMLLPFVPLMDKENAPDFGAGFRCVR